MTKVYAPTPTPKPILPATAVEARTLSSIPSFVEDTQHAVVSVTASEGGGRDSEDTDKDGDSGGSLEGIQLKIASSSTDTATTKSTSNNCCSVS